MTTTDPPTRAGPSPRLWWTLGTLAVLASTALAVWFTVAAATDRVQWMLTGFEVVDSSQVDVRFDITRDPSREVICTLAAQDGSHTVVGRTDVTVPPAASSPSRHIDSVRTAGPAVAGYIDSCRYAVASG